MVYIYTSPERKRALLPIALYMRSCANQQAMHQALRVKVLRSLHLESYVATLTRHAEPVETPLYFHHTERSLVCHAVFATSAAKPACSKKMK